MISLLSEGKETVICSFAQVSEEGEKYTFLVALCLNTLHSGGGGSHCLGWQVYWLRSHMMRPLLTQVCSWCSPWLLSKCPLWAFTGGSRNHNRRVGRKNLRILYTFLLSSASAMCLGFFSPLVIIFYTRRVHCLYKVIPHGSSHGNVTTFW